MSCPYERKAGKGAAASSGSGNIWPGRRVLWDRGAQGCLPRRRCSERGCTVLTLLFLVLLYFLPSIIGRDKRDAAGIILLNVFLGWTVIGWVIALVWAITAEPYSPVRLVSVPAGGRFCCQCGTFVYPGAHFCTACGRTV